jgi:Cu(I)/Ag(I) efflux system membrane fusion protein
MKRLWFLLIVALAGGLFAAADGGAALYRCPMHPAVTAPKAAKCTICGMDLVAGLSATAGAPPGVVALSPSVITTIGVETTAVAKQPLTRSLRVVGRIEDDDTSHRILSARVPGRVEKLHLNYVGASVEAGAPLATIYSPEMLTAQRVYVERLKAGEGAFPAAARAEAREKLFELGLPENEIAALETGLKPSATIVLRAPAAGTVVAKSVYEGQYVQASDRLFEIADFSKMWFVFDAYAQDIPWLKPGQTVEITTQAVPGETISAPIEFIDPNFDEARQSARVRAVLPNPHYSVAGQPHSLPHRVLAEGRVLVASPEVLAAPRAAVLDTGRGPVAYVQQEAGHFQSRPVQLGRRGDTLVEIVGGLAEGDKVVTRGALLIDAQAQLTNEASGAAHAHSAPLDPALREHLNRAIPVAIEAAAALAADDFARYQAGFAQLSAAATGLPALPKLDPGADLKSARLAFEPWVTQLADLARPHRVELGVKVFQCPMTPFPGKGRWLQRDAPLRNPFFGSTMLECGDELR